MISLDQNTPAVDTPVTFIVRDGEPSFGCRYVENQSTHCGFFNGNYWISERLISEKIGRAKLYHTHQIQEWKYSECDRPRVL